MNCLAYVLHSRPWRETSLLLDMLTDQYGRVSMIAKGAKRPHSPLRGILEPFCPLTIQCSGRSDLKNLTNAQWVQAPNPLPAAHAMAGWYMSELCLRGMAEVDPHPEVFSAYKQAIENLHQVAPDADVQSILRVFEYQFIHALGLWPEVEAAVQSQLYYTLDEHDQWRIATLENASWCVQGAQLLALQRQDYAVLEFDKHTLRAAMRVLIAKAVPNHLLNTRLVWLELDRIGLS